MNKEFHIRFADMSDRDALRALQAHSFRTLGSAYYESDVVEAFIGDIGTMDDSLLTDGTYFVAVHDDRIVGGGGWSRRPPRYASRLIEGEVAPLAGHASLQSLYVDPAFTRRGITAALMTAIEENVAANGYEAVALTATFSGILFYRNLGYHSAGLVTLRMRDDLAFHGLNMTKRLAAADFAICDAA